VRKVRQVSKERELAGRDGSTGTRLLEAPHVVCGSSCRQQGMQGTCQMYDAQQRQVTMFRDGATGSWLLEATHGGCSCSQKSMQAHVRCMVCSSGKQQSSWRELQGPGSWKHPMHLAGAAACRARDTYDVRQRHAAQSGLAKYHTGLLLSDICGDWPISPPPCSAPQQTTVHCSSNHDSALCSACSQLLWQAPTWWQAPTCIQCKFREPTLFNIQSILRA
jgi:hypothetical protein